MSVEVRPLTAHIGAEVLGLDLSRPLEPDQIARVQEAFGHHSVLVFRNQTITPEEHIAFSRHFGRLEIHVLTQYLLKEHPEILVLSNILEDGKQVGIVDAGQYWHSDLSYKETPSRGSILYARKIPAPDGDRTYGDTCFVSSGAAFDALDDGLRARLTTLQARHQYEARYQRMQDQNAKRQTLTEAQLREVPAVVHPVVRIHPLTGRQCLYVNEGFTTEIVGLAEEESRKLLSMLFAHCTEERFMYRHKWQLGDVLMWDNCLTQHLAVADYGPHQHRLMHRTTLGG